MRRCHGVDAEHERVAGQRPRAGAEDQPPRVRWSSSTIRSATIRVVVRERDHAGPQPDVAGALGSGGDEHLGAGDDLVARGVVLAEPDLVVAEPIECDHAVEVVLQRQGGFWPTGWNGAKKAPKRNGQGAGMPFTAPGCYENRNGSRPADLPLWRRHVVTASYRQPSLHGEVSPIRGPDPLD